MLTTMKLQELQEMKSSERFIRQFSRQWIGVIEKQKECTDRCRQKEGAKVNIEAGRYALTGYPSGNIYIYDKDDNLLVREIVGEKVGAPTLTWISIQRFQLFLTVAIVQ